jgi:hypothetical protein
VNIIKRSAATLLAAGAMTLGVASTAHAEQWVTIGHYETLSSCHAAGNAYAAKYHPKAWTCDADSSPRYGYDLRVFE